MTSEHTLIVTEADLERLRQVVDHSGGGRTAEFAEMLDAELTRARVVTPEKVPSDVVTMNSKVVFEDEQTGERREVTLVYPREASSDDGRISVLAPIGSALIGLSVGQSIAWPLPGGRTKKLRIVAIPYQPEASGHFNL